MASMAIQGVLMVGVEGERMPLGDADGGGVLGALCFGNRRIRTRAPSSQVSGTRMALVLPTRVTFASSVASTSGSFHGLGTING